MKSLLTTLLLLTAFATGAMAQTTVETKHFNLEKGITALEGYDPVSYHQGKEPVKGSKNLTTTFNGVTYQFANQANLDTFNANPEQYEPAYGGWCAFAMGSYGKKTKVNPKTFKIVDGKLNLFYNGVFGNTLPKWNDDEAKLKPVAKKNWATIISE
ncbi:MAG: YHS domain-containing (seleno)protein [Bacteroidota bacterium]